MILHVRYKEKEANAIKQDDFSNAAFALEDRCLVVNASGNQKIYNPSVWLEAWTTND